MADTTTEWDTGHELLRRAVKHQPTGRTGTVGGVLITRARGGSIVSRTAHVRPEDGSGWEWTAPAAELHITAPISPATHPRTTT
ncbi:hypothetical protein ACFV2X_47970 [Streptomyces sp. NPDC059679]|uniref:hypothetical protein n=1 Tax=Streptomyces sp. NPDC059679 TaxID=3346903 RepID=UPI003695A6FF